jgi:hypothetical protein
MLELTPIGTNMYDVLEIVRTNGWKDVTGGYAQINDRGVPMEELGSVGEPIGEKSIRAWGKINKSYSWRIHKIF